MLDCESGRVDPHKNRIKIIMIYSINQFISDYVHTGIIQIVVF